MKNQIVLSALALAGMPSAGLAGEVDSGEIVVIATPLGEPAATIVDTARIERSHATSAADMLARLAPGVSINEIQGNPLQPDISYRGFTASPLLGTPQGISVYLDGIRINQPFGDIVSWDLVPSSIIKSIDLISSASPQFGRNSLGGALAVQTKDGLSAPGLAGDIGYGSFDRLEAKLQAGGHGESGLHWFIAADHFREDGWRAFSPSRATRAFAKLGWAEGSSGVSLSGLFADTDLQGNGLQEMQLLAADRRSVYTAPDNTQNRSGLVALNARHDFSDQVQLRGNLFWRDIRTATYNGDINDEALGQSLYQPSAEERTALSAAGYSGFPLSGETQDNTAFPKWRCIANVLLNSEPNEKCNGLVNRSLAVQSEWGGGAELTYGGPIGGLEQKLTLGLSYVRNRAHFTQSTQFGYLLPDRTVMAVQGSGAFADGTQDSEEAFDARVDLDARTESLGLYVLQQAQLTPRVQLDLAGRFDRTAVRNRDRITPGGGPGSLDSSPVYSRFNPAAALRWRPDEGTGLTVAWSQASRAPSAIELGCSDPESPCRLPNALAGDPPLNQVIARSIELKGSLTRRGWSVSAGLFRTDSSDDIIFVSDSVSGYGYFRNFGQTRRQGIEFQAAAKFRAWNISANYTFLDATYRSAELVGGAGNSTNDGPAPGFEGSIAIRPGDRLPLVPRHMFKLAAEWTPNPAVSLNLDMVAAAGTFAQGNENNRHTPDGIYHLGPGQTEAYAVFNLGGEWRLGQGLRAFASIRNLFDKQYATAARLAATGFDPSGRFVARPFAGPTIDGERPLVSSTFYAPGAPRSVQVGMGFRF